MYERTLRRDSARGALWGEREVLLPHLLQHRCAVTDEAKRLCYQARWDYDSYLLAVVYDRRDLIAEVAR